METHSWDTLYMTSVYLVISAQEPRIFVDKLGMFEQWKQVLYKLDCVCLIMVLINIQDKIFSIDMQAIFDNVRLCPNFR